MSTTSEHPATARADGTVEPREDLLEGAGPGGMWWVAWRLHRTTVLGASA